VCALTAALGSTSGSIHNLCAETVDDGGAWAFHVKQLRWMTAYPPLYPQGVYAFYVVFHVKLACLWITPVDNLGRGAGSTEGDGCLRFGHWLNG
jgi:hypothetical protein